MRGRELREKPADAKRPREEVSLGHVAPGTSPDILVVARLDTFGVRSEAEGPGDVHERVELGAAVPFHLPRRGWETAFDVQGVHRQQIEVTESGSAGAEVVS